MSRWAHWTALGGSGGSCSGLQPVLMQQPPYTCEYDCQDDREVDMPHYKKDPPGSGIKHGLPAADCVFCCNAACSSYLPPNRHPDLLRPLYVPRRNSTATLIHPRCLPSTERRRGRFGLYNLCVTQSLNISLVHQFKPQERRVLCLL